MPIIIIINTSNVQLNSNGMEMMEQAFCSILISSNCYELNECELMIGRFAIKPNLRFNLLSLS